MFRPRIIPVLLLKNKGLVKSVKFKSHRYIGDPINAVKIFNDLKADELVFLDILASKEGRTISTEFVRQLGEEANMPFAVGGGIKSLSDIQTIIGEGAEKVIVCTYAVKNPDFIRQAALSFGSSTIVVCMDVKRSIWGRDRTWILNGSISTNYSPIDFAQLMEQNGAGEIIVQSIERDGTMTGYDINLIRKISEAVTIPVIALGGAGEMQHLKDAYSEGFANGLAVGSMFVYHGQRKAVLVNYPSKDEANNYFIR